MAHLWRLEKVVWNVILALTISATSQNPAIAFRIALNTTYLRSGATVVEDWKLLSSRIQGRSLDIRHEGRGAAALSQLSRLHELMSWETGYGHTGRWKGSAWLLLRTACEAVWEFPVHEYPPVISSSSRRRETHHSAVQGISQIQDNGNDLEEERGDDFVEIDDMLLDELDLSGLLHYDSDCNGRYNGQDSCCDGRCDGCCGCSYDLTTKARPPEGLKRQRPREEEAEGRRLLVVVILRPLATKKASMPTSISSWPPFFSSRWSPAPGNSETVQSGSRSPVFNSFKIVNCLPSSPEYQRWIVDDPVVPRENFLKPCGMEILSWHNRIPEKIANENTTVKESNSRPQPPILPRASERLKDRSLILSKIFSLPNHTIPKRPGRFLTELHLDEKNGCCFGAGWAVVW
ncbi:hypothetical protein V8E54_001892 [Elaphomyces granulatus]